MSIPAYRALDLLTKGGCAPKVRGEKPTPFWRPKAPGCVRSVHTPDWSWSLYSKTEPGNELVVLDVNAAYVAALSSATFAYGALEHTGPDTDARAPGLYLITIPAWNVPDLPSPLGTAGLRETAWVAHPTIEQLHKVAANGHMAPPEILDSHTARVSCRFRTWAERIRDDRAEYIDRRDAERPGTEARKNREAEYKEFKDAYSQAVQMFLGKDGKPSKSDVYRPDWYHTVLAQHAASTWRKAYTAWRAGCGPAEIGSRDEVTFVRSDWEQLQRMTPPPFRIDQTGKTLGSFKIKDEFVVLENTYV